MRSSWSLGVVYIVLGGLAVSGIGRQPVAPPTPASWAIAVLLIVAGLALFTKTRAAFYLALAAGAVTAASGILAFAHHPELSLPVHPALSIGIGLYLVFRTAIAASAFGPKKPKGFVPRDDA